MRLVKLHLAFVFHFINMANSHLTLFYHVSKFCKDPLRLFKLLTAHWNNFAEKYYFSNKNK